MHSILAIELDAPRPAGLLQAGGHQLPFPVRQVRKLPQPVPRQQQPPPPPPAPVRQPEQVNPQDAAVQLAERIRAGEQIFDLLLNI
jgi:hypothetical protein